MRRAVPALVLAILVAPRPARGEGPLGPNGSPIRTSDYAIDLSAGPVIAGPRALGLAGAYVAIAEGVDGNLQNPASAAVRAAWSKHHVEGDASFNLLFPSTLESTDFYNSGATGTDLKGSDQREFALLSTAGNLQVGPWGGGLGLELQRYGLLRRPDPALGGREQLVRAQISTVRSYLARAVDDGQIVGGLGLAVTALDVTTENEIFTRSGNVFTTRGVSLEGGLLWRPSRQHFRVGFALRAPVTTSVDSGGKPVNGDIVEGDPTGDAIWLPKRVKRPWSSDFGVAVSLGPRPFNVPWLDPVSVMRRVDQYLERRERLRAERQRQAELRGPSYAASVADELAAEARDDERYRELQVERLQTLLQKRYADMPRGYFLISASVHADGDVTNAVGIESFLQRRVNRSGDVVTLSPRLGVETEAVPNWLRLRAGTYLEPSRFREASAREHGTAGFDLRLFRWSLFGLLDDDAALQLSAASDYAPRYFGWALSVGVWH